MDLAADAAARGGQGTRQEGEEEVAPAIAALHGRIADYYSAKVERHGPTPAGVDWSCEPTQQLRFVQLMRIADFSQPCSVNDIGCGYGALFGFIRQRHPKSQVDYCGIDVSTAMVEHARKLWKRHRNAVFAASATSPRSADYSMASGIFNVRIDEPVALWESFVERSLHDIAATSRAGFAVNFLRTLPDGVEGKPELYRCEPARWVQFCERESGGAVQILDSYGMREFTLLVRR